MDVDRSDLWTLMICTLRYALGRMTYITSQYPILYGLYRGALTPHQRDQIAREVEKALAHAESLGSTLGMEIDHDNWRRFAERIRAEER